MENKEKIEHGSEKNLLRNIVSKKDAASENHQKGIGLGEIVVGIIIGAIVTAAVMNVQKPKQAMELNGMDKPPEEDLYEDYEVYKDYIVQRRKKGFEDKPDNNISFRL